MIRKQEVIICPVSRERIQNRKKKYGNICFHRGSGIVKTISDYLELLILYYRNTGLLYLSMDVSGTDIRAVATSLYRRQIQTSG